ncbi:MAG: MFS transporter [Ktedonobacteraceae bacterium]
MIPVIARAVNVSEGAAGQLVTAFSLTYGLGAPFLAALTSRFSRTRLLLASLGAFAIVNLGSALAPTFGLLLITRVLAGCCAAIYAPLAYTTGTALAPPEKRGQTLALIAGSLTIATVFGSPLGTWIGHQFGWQMTFVLVAVLAGLAFLALVLYKLPHAAPSAALSVRERLAPIAQPTIVLALVPSLLWYVGVYTDYTYLAPIFQHSLHVSDISGLLIAFGIGVVIGNASGGRIADHFGPLRPLIASLLVLIIMLSIISVASTSLITGSLALFIFGISSSLLFIPQQYRLMSLASEHANVVLALNNSTLYLGIAGGAALGGIAVQSAPIFALGWVGTACCLLALLILFISIRVSTRIHTSIPTQRETSSL